MLTNLRRSVVMAAICLVFFGFVYALAGTGVAQVLFPHQADGSVTANGSTLIGQNWAATKCPGHPLGSCVFHGRPDDTGPYAANAKEEISGGDNPLVANGVAGESAATNLGPRSKVLLADTKALIAYWHKLGVDDPTTDLVTTSGSGYDPDITPPDATVQIPMVSAATGIPAPTLTALIKKETHSAELGFLGSDYIDVLQLNEALAKLR
jgi:K+-transporting ATPase ATPase C chain